MPAFTGPLPYDEDDKCKATITKPGNAFSLETKKLVAWNQLMFNEYSRRPPPPRDEPFVDQFRGGQGQSYRPGGARERSPPPIPRARERSPLPPARTDSYRARSPPRRAEYGVGDSYRAPRPRSRTPPRRDEYPPRRRSPSPPRYRDAREAVRGGTDSYRGRPRSPPPRREELPRDDLFRRESARDYRDEPVRDYRDERDYVRDERYAPPARSPPPRYRERSPFPLKRAREPSPIGSRGRRTPPPPAKRERLASPPRGRYDDYPPSRAASPPRRRYSPDPRDRRPASPPRGVTRDYRLRSRSPLTRNERVDPRDVDDWRRRRSPSPVRQSRQDYYADEVGRESVATSRRSSPPVHPSRLALQQPPPVDERASRLPPPRDPYEREPYRARSPEPVRRRDSPPPAREQYVDDRGYANGADDRIPPPREPYRADDAPVPRAPPSGPAGYRAPATAMAPPTGPAAATVPISAHQRAPAVPPSGPRAAAMAPSAPRGDFGPRGRGGFRGDFAPRGRGGFRGGFGGGAPAGPGFGRGDSFASRGGGDFNRQSFDDKNAAHLGGGPPAGPRGSFSQGPRDSFSSQVPTPPAGPGQGFRQGSNSTATTYPRSQRFAPNGQPIPDGPSHSNSPHPPSGPRRARRPTEPILSHQQQQLGRSASAPHPAIASLPTIVDGGQKAEPLIDTTRLTKLQEEAEKLRKLIEEKEAKKRKGLREWDRMSREVAIASERSQLADEAVRKLNGEAEGTAAF